MCPLADAARREVEFLVNPDVGALEIQRAELHVQISNPDRVRVEPVLTLQHAENQDAVSSRLGTGLIQHYSNNMPLGSTKNALLHIRHGKWWCRITDT